MSQQKTKKNSNGCEIINNMTVILKADLHCDGCANKVLRSIRAHDGVETAKICEAQKITVVGKVDPMKILETVQKKTRGKVELISPKAPKQNAENDRGKGKENAKNKENSSVEDAGKHEAKENESKESKKKQDNKSDDKKSQKNKEPPITTAVLKVQLHCEGCTQKIKRIVTKTKGYQDMKIDKLRELVTVTGSLDMKALAEALKKHLKRHVEIVPQKKEGGEKKENNNKNNSNSEKKENNSSNGKKGKGGGDGENCSNKQGGEKMGPVKEQKAQQCQVVYSNPLTYGSGCDVDHQQFHYYNQYPIGLVHAPQLFSDENPNACSVM